MQGLSTIITFYNGLSSLKMCIKLLQDALKAEDIYEIIVVNDNPAMNINFLEDEYSVQVLNMPEIKGMQQPVIMLLITHGMIHCCLWIVISIQQVIGCKA